jgi:RHH-type transcriptional regulator, rel operon repressor / antitoxin RelB
MGTVSLRLSDRDDALIRKYAEIHNLDLSSFIRETVLARIEEDYDLALFDRVWEETREETREEERYSHDQVKKELGL